MIDLAITAQIVVWLAVVGIFLASGQASLFHPATWYLAFHGLVFVARPLAVQCFGFDSVWKYMMFEPTEAMLIRSLLVSSVGMIVFCAASFGAGYSKIQFTPLPASPFTTSQIRALTVVTILLAPLIAYSIYRGETGGGQGELRGGTFVMTGDSGYTVEAQFMATPLLCAWLVVTGFSWVGLIPLTIYTGYRAYLGWNRWTLLLFFLALAMAYSWDKRQKWLPPWMIACALPLLLLFHTLGENRAYVRRLLIGEDTGAPTTVSYMTPEEKLKARFDAQEFANFDYLTYVLSVVPDRTGTYTYGTQYLQIFTEPIPRKLWAGKPAGAPVALVNLNEYGNFIGLTVSLAGDGWMSGGWIGLVLTMGIAGCLWGSAHRWFWRHQDWGVGAILYTIALAMMPQHARDGGISIAKFLFWNMTPLLLWTGIDWLMGARLVVAQTVLIPAGTQLRLIQSGPDRRPPPDGSRSLRGDIRA